MILSLLLALAVSAELTVVTIPPRGDLDLALTPTGKVQLKREGTLTRVKVEIDKLRLWSGVGPSFYCYVVWAVSPEGAYENLGELRVDGADGFIESTTHLDQLSIIVSAEPHYLVDRPSAYIMYRNQAPREANIRRIIVPVQIGQFDYSRIQIPPEPQTPSLFFQARAAFQIARDSGAEKWAEGELRLARVALDTMEEMRRRTAPYEIIAITAHEAIRRSQQALVGAREQSGQIALKEVEKEIVRLSGEKERLETRVREVTEQLNAANNQIRNLNDQIAAANKTSVQLTQQREQAETNLRNAERELARVKRQEEDLQSRLWLKFQTQHFDENGLTPSGREALARVCGVAGVVPGPIQLEGFPSEVAFQSVMLYLVEAKIPHDRIITRR